MSVFNSSPHKQANPTMTRPTVHQRLTSITNTINAMERKIVQFRAEGRLEDAEFFNAHLADLQALRARELNSVQDFVPRQSPFAMAPSPTTARTLQMASSPSDLTQKQLGDSSQAFDSFPMHLKDSEILSPQPQLQSQDQQFDLAMYRATSPQLQQFGPAMSRTDATMKQSQHCGMIESSTHTPQGFSHSDGQLRDFNRIPNQISSPPHEEPSTRLGGEKPLKHLSVPDQMRRQLEMRVREAREGQEKDVEKILRASHGTELVGANHAVMESNRSFHRPMPDPNIVAHNHPALVESVHPEVLGLHLSPDRGTAYPKEEAIKAGPVESIWDIIEKKKEQPMINSHQPKPHDQYEKKSSASEISSLLNSFPAWRAAQSPTAAPSIIASTGNTSEQVASTPGPILDSMEKALYLGGTQASKDPGVIGEGYGRKHIENNGGIPSVHPYNHTSGGNVSFQNPHGIIGQGRGRDHIEELNVKMERMALANSTGTMDEVGRRPVRSLAFMKLERDALDGAIEELGDEYRTKYDQWSLFDQVLEKETDLSL